MLDRVTNRSRGFGFVHFNNKEDMDEAVEKMHETELDGRKISVNRAIPQDSIQPGTPAAAIGRRSDRCDQWLKLSFKFKASSADDACSHSAPCLQGPGPQIRPIRALPATRL